MARSSTISRGRLKKCNWRVAFTLKEEGLTEYLFESEMAKALQAALPDFTAAGTNKQRGKDAVKEVAQPEAIH